MQVVTNPKPAQKGQGEQDEPERGAKENGKKERTEPEMNGGSGTG